MCGEIFWDMFFGSLLFNMSDLRTMGTRESSKGTSIATSQTLKDPLPYKVLLSYPDPRLTIGARIPIPYQVESILPYSGENVFGRKKRRLTTVSPPLIPQRGSFFCYYCNVQVKHMAKHVSTVKCRERLEKFLTLPQLTNIRAFWKDATSPIVLDDEVPPPNFSPLAIEWAENFLLISQLARMGLVVDFGTSDFLLSAANIPAELRECCALQTRSGTFLEALLLSVS